jgi:hypothetical protein
LVTSTHTVPSSSASSAVARKASGSAKPMTPRRRQHCGVVTAGRWVSWTGARQSPVRAAMTHGPSSGRLGPRRATGEPGRIGERLVSER